MIPVLLSTMVLNLFRSGLGFWGRKDKCGKVLLLAVVCREACVIVSSIANIVLSLFLLASAVLSLVGTVWWARVVGWVALLLAGGVVYDYYRCSKDMSGAAVAVAIASNDDARMRSVSLREWQSQARGRFFLQLRMETVVVCLVVSVCL